MTAGRPEWTERRRQADRRRQSARIGVINLVALLLYNLVFPLGFLLYAPFYAVHRRAGGWGLLQRFGVFDRHADRCGGYAVRSGSMR